MYDINTKRLIDKSLSRLNYIPNKKFEGYNSGTNPNTLQSFNKSNLSSIYEHPKLTYNYKENIIEGMPWVYTTLRDSQGGIINKKTTNAQIVKAFKDKTERDRIAGIKRFLDSQPKTTKSEKTNKQAKNESPVYPPGYGPFRYDHTMNTYY
jgi:hypothetical protein